MKSKDLLKNNRSEIYENTMVNKEDRYKNLPDYSLRITGVIHSKAHAIKEIGTYNNINEVLEDALETLINNYDKDFKNEIIEEEKRNNEKKLRRIKFSKKK